MRKVLLLSTGAILASVPQVALADIVISPRVSYYYDNVNQRASGLDEAGVISDEELEEQRQEFRDLFGDTADLQFETTSTGINNDQLALPMYGLAGTIIDGDWSVTFTGMYGEADGEVRSNSTGIMTTSLFGFEATDIAATAFVGTQEAERIDLELTAQKRINERFAIMGGVRYEHVDATIDGTVAIDLSNNQVNLISALFAQPPEFQVFRETSELGADATYEVYSVRGGFAGFIPFGENNTVFLNGMLHLSHEPAPDITTFQTDIATGETVSATATQRGETTLGPDMAVGVQLGLSENVSLDVRYRGAFYFPVGGGRSFDDPRVNHGINAGVSFRF